jgi:RNA 3'-terminal phosphate cyclase (ATP)
LKQCATPDSHPVLIDGSYGEGGGQILRTSLSLSLITGRPVEIINIRAGRSRPGLQPQHLASVRAAAAPGNARLEGDRVGSNRLLFYPRSPVRPGSYRCEIGTAGAATLVAQTTLLPLWMAGGPSDVTITGGTHVPHSPPADYLESVYMPLLARAGIQARAKTEAVGFYPRGGGEISLEIRPVGNAPRAAPLDLTARGRLRRLQAIVTTALLPEHVAARGQKTIQQRLRAAGHNVTVSSRDLLSAGPGAAVALIAECQGVTAGFSSIGARGKPMERVAEEPCDEFLAWWASGAACDEHLADQLVLPLCLAAGESRWTTPLISDHLRTVVWVAEQFLPIQAALTEPADGPALVILTPLD